MSIAFNNLKQHLELAIQALRELKSSNYYKERVELCTLENTLSNLITDFQRRMNATEIKAALEGILKATLKTTFSPRDKALLGSLLHTIEFSILACPNSPGSSCPPTASSTRS